MPRLRPFYCVNAKSCLAKQCVEASQSARRAKGEALSIQLGPCLLQHFTSTFIRATVYPNYKRCHQVQRLDEDRGRASAVQKQGMAVLTKVHGHQSVWRMSMHCRLSVSSYKMVVGTSQAKTVRQSPYS